MLGDDVVEQPVGLVLKVLDLPAVLSAEKRAVKTDPVGDLELAVEHPDQKQEHADAQDRLSEQGRGAYGALAGCHRDGVVVVKAGGGGGVAVGPLLAGERRQENGDAEGANGGKQALDAVVEGAHVAEVDEADVDQLEEEVSFDQALGDLPTTEVGENGHHGEGGEQ